MPPFKKPATSRRSLPKNWQRDLNKEMGKRVVVEKAPRRPLPPTSRTAADKQEHGPNKSPPHLISAAAETTLQASSKPSSADDRFTQLLDDCDRVAEGRSVFGEALDRIRHALVAAYPMFGEIKRDVNAHARLVAHLKQRHGRERAGSLAKPALNAVIAACHPRDSREQKLCSDWMNVLVLADLTNIAEGNFAPWVSNRGIADSKEQIRKLKRGDKPRATAIRLPFKQSEFPCVTHAIACGNPGVLKPLREAFERAESLLRRRSAGGGRPGSCVQLELPFTNTVGP